MEFHKKLSLKDGNTCILRNAESSDAEDFLHYFELAHRETNFLTTYPDESTHTVSQMAAHLDDTKASKTDIEICALVHERIIGSAGISMIHDRDKTRHRAEFGISIVKDYWGLGIGSELITSCIECAKKAGFLQIELDVVAENVSALHLYKKYGFVEFGKNPRGFRTREGAWQELISMRLEL